MATSMSTRSMTRRSRSGSRGVTRTRRRTNSRRLSTRGERSLRSRRRDGHGRFVRRGSRRRTSTGRRSNLRGGRTYRGRSRPASRGARTVGRRRRAPNLQRDASGRFLPRDALIEFEEVDPSIGAGIVREASVRSRALPAREVIKRRWWRAEGPQDPALPRGYAYQDQVDND